MIDVADQIPGFLEDEVRSRIAKADLDAVEPAIEPLIDVLGEDFAYTQSNACWALGYLATEDAIGRLREVEETDPNEEVRHAALVAIDEIESR